MAERVYLDNAATAPLRPEAAAAMTAAFVIHGNPSSVHAEGRAARALLRRARQTLAVHTGFDAEGVVFTAGGSEANALALHQASTRGKVTLVAATAHASALAGPGVETLPVDRHGLIDLDVLERRLRREPEIGVVSTLLVNNETGIIDDHIAAAAPIVAAAGALLHVDAVQALGHVDFRPSGVADMVSVAAHKLGGPKGIGALLVGDRIDVRPLIAGGGQEGRRRAGTEATVLIAGFAAALDAAIKADDAARLEALGSYLLDAVQTAIPRAIEVAGHVGVDRSARIAALVLPGVPAMTQLMALDLDGIAVSAGSACTSGKVEPSHVLRAMDLPEAWTGSAIRVSLGHATTTAEIDRFVQAYGRLAA